MPYLFNSLLPSSKYSFVSFIRIKCTIMPSPNQLLHSVICSFVVVLCVYAVYNWRGVLQTVWNLLCFRLTWEAYVLRFCLQVHVGRFDVKQQQIVCSGHWCVWRISHTGQKRPLFTLEETGDGVWSGRDMEGRFVPIVPTFVVSDVREVLYYVLHKLYLP